MATNKKSQQFRRNYYLNSSSRSPVPLALSQNSKLPRAPHAVSPARRSRAFRPAVLLQTLYWYVFFPGLIFMAIRSIRNISQLVSRNGTGLDSSQEPHPSKSSIFATGGKSFTKSKQQTPKDMAPQAQAAVSSGKPQYPDFVQLLETQKERLKSQAQAVRHSDSNHVRHHFYLAETHDDQRIPFTQPILPSPKIRPNATMVVLVLSLGSQDHFLKRQAIRETWARNATSRSPSTQVLFVIGHANCGVSSNNSTTVDSETDGYMAGDPSDFVDDNFSQTVGGEEKQPQRKLLEDEGNDGMIEPTSTKIITSHNTSVAFESEKVSVVPRKEVGGGVQTKSLPRSSEDSDCAQEEHDFLLQEQLMYHDLLEIPMEEQYKRLPEKVVQSYNWALQHFPQLKWIVKADDDSFLRISSLERYLLKYNHEIPFLIGKIVPHSLVAKEGKWKDEDYDEDYYPFWPQGSAGYVLSRTTAEYVVKTSTALHRYQGEDVSVGIWLDEAHRSKTLEHITYIQAKGMISNGGYKLCGTDKFVMIGHDFSPEEQKGCQEKYGDTIYEERAWLDDPAEFEKTFGIRR